MTDPRIDRVLGPAGPELGCDECFEYLDLYAEQNLGLASGFALCRSCVAPAECGAERHCLGMRAHLSGCPACAEEYQSLLALVQGGRPTE
jgi:hypothetical protein